MKKLFSKICVFALSASVAAVFQSCVSENPFDSSAEGKLQLRTLVSRNVTRAADDSDGALAEKCIVYISSEKGLIRKYKGLGELPESINLKTGYYVAEAWTGDSVSASFDKKFYRGYQPFEMTPGDNQVTLTCKIANVLVSIDPSSYDVGLTHLSVKVGHKRGELVFTDSDKEAKGYFMMPNNVTDLYYIIEGEDVTGKLIKKEGVIENVKRAHEYILTLKADNKDPILGGAFFRVVIEDTPVFEDTIEIFGRPLITGDGFSLKQQVVGAPGEFKDRNVYVRAYKGLDRLTLKAVSNEAQLSSVITEVGILSASADIKTRLENAGIHWTNASILDEQTGIISDEYFITFSKKFLDELPESATEYGIEISAMDGQGKTTVDTLKIANTDAAVTFVAPVKVENVMNSSNPMAVTSHKANLNVTLNDNATSPSLEYREAGESDWNSVNVDKNGTSRVRSLTRAGDKTVTVSISGLKPATEYEYRVVDGDYTSDIMRFTTEGIFSIPNNSFENWSSYSASTMLGTKNVILPWMQGDKDLSFWGSGNEGAATANMTLTDKSTDMVHSGTYSARLESKAAMGMLAAGNIFIGSYVRTDGTNGILSLGRSYDGSHPDKVSVWANYRPATGVTIKSGNEEFVPADFEGGNDHGQIYVALTSAPIEIRTNPSDRKLFNKDDDEVLAYGEVTWTDNFGPDGQLEKVEIPLVYNSRANSIKPLYLVIVVSASKYGDYFSGAKGSVMYLDDFELIYNQ